ncbi:hypothetical protein [Microbacterium aurantiacum]|uniref:hypothetical protein n=1 Tax=Microbacterium aurantiacum TaxID=162393 RepID=UPI000C803B4B|nr:hypothetical protein [Microbacterium aurantiacum]
MDNGAFVYAIFALPFWMGIITVGIVLLLLIPIGLNVVLRIMIDGILAANRRRSERAYVRKHQANISDL